MKSCNRDLGRGFAGRDILVGSRVSRETTGGVMPNDTSVILFLVLFVAWELRPGPRSMLQAVWRIDHINLTVYLLVGSYSYNWALQHYPSGVSVADHVGSHPA